MSITLNGTTGISTPDITSTTAPSLVGTNFTSLPSASLTGALPAISGSSLTSLTSASLTGALPAIDGSALTGVGASTTFDAVGTYVWGRRAGSTSAQTQFVAGTTYAGTTLYPAGLANTNGDTTLKWATSVNSTWVGSTASAALSGTWRAMGTSPTLALENPVTLFVRIS